MDRAIPRDLGLAIRILFVTLLLACMYGAVVVVYVWLVIHDPTDLRAWLGLPVLALALWLFISKTPGAALAAVRARPPAQDERPEVRASLERLANLADTPVPTLAISDNRVPNAFAVGLGTGRATIVVTHGLLDVLTPDEVEAVLAHELTHIVNRDAFVVTVASTFPIIGANLDKWRFGGRDYRNRDADDPTEFLVRPFEIVFGGVLYLIGAALTLAISRYREFVADRGSAVLTGAPENLMSALQKVADTHARIPRRDLRAMERLTALCIVSAAKKPGWLERDHPPLEQRLAALAEIAREMSRRVT